MNRRKTKAGKSLKLDSDPSVASEDFERSLQHERAGRKPKNRIDYKCSICEDPFFSLKMLENHVRKHHKSELMKQ